jgi:hypothetical protein
MTRCFWQEIKLVTGCKLPFLHPSTWARDLLSGQSCSSEEAALFICGAWSLWTGRNAQKHGRNNSDPRAAAMYIAKMVEDVICLNLGAHHQTPRPKSKWSKPGFEWRKINTDASFVASSCSGSGGIVIRDDSGKVVAAAARHYNHVPDVLTAEALAARDGVVLA